MRVLIIENCAVFKNVLRLFLGKLPMSFEYVSSVEEVTPLVCPTIRYDLIVASYELPGESGLSFMRRLKHEGHFPCPMIIMTTRKDMLKGNPETIGVVDGVLYKPRAGAQLRGYLKEIKTDSPEV